MAQFPVNTHRLDPYRNFKFQVQWDNEVIPGISKVSALCRRTEVLEHRDGADPSRSLLSPGATEFDRIELERGVTHDTAFEDWANLVHNAAGDAAMSLRDFRKDVRIELLNLQGTPVKAYNAFRCWVVEYQPLSELDANCRGMTCERLVLQTEGWERDVALSEPTET